MKRGCSIIRDSKTGEIKEVLAPNGEESILYNNLLDVKPSSEDALRSWATAYTDAFKQYHGDWENPTKAKTKEFTPNKALETFDFGSKEGTPQSKETDQLIHKNIIESPDKSMYDEGESFNEAFKRTIPPVADIVKTAPANSVLVTHNSIFGLIRLWNELGRPEEFTQEDRVKYTEQDNKFPTGSVYELQGDKGIIYLVRHGETQDNLDKKYRRRAVELTSKGLEQAREAGLELKSKLKGQPIGELITSPLSRTIETSKIILNENIETAKFDKILDKNGEPLIKDVLDYESSIISLPSESEPKLTQTKVNEILNNKIQNFLEKIGVSIQAVDNIRDKDGNIVKDAVAKASMLDKIIQVIEGKMSIDTLPEEAAHFFIEMLGPGHPLYKQMYDKITSYDIYSRTFNQYKDQRAFRNADGTINYDKIKKEAIGKLIAQHIIRMDPGPETETRLVSAIKWWQKLWDFIKSVFIRADENPFEDAATKIMMGETEDLKAPLINDEEYYQLVDPLQGLMIDQNKITLDNSIDPRTGQKRHIYQYEGQQAKGSVTSVYVDNWLKKIFKTDNRSELQKVIDLAKAEFGDVVHEQIQDIIKSWTFQDGTKRTTQSPIAPKVDPTTFKRLNNFIQAVMDQYEEGTVFKSEVKIFDKKTQIAGSIDLLVVMPEGTVEIYDWKTQEIYADQFDIKGYKEPMYRIQLENYRKILELQYGFKKFGRIRAIPIATSFVKEGRNIVRLRSVEIGSLNPLEIPENKNYLLPVILRTETTGDERLDKLVERLHGIYDKIDKQRYTKEEVFKKREELEQLRTAIRDLQLRNQIDRLIDLGLVQLQKYQQKVLDKTLSGKEIPEAISILSVFSEGGITLYDMRQELRKALEESNDPKALAKFDALDKKFLIMTSKVTSLIRDIEAYRNEQAKALGEKNGIFNLLDPEKTIGVIKGYFSSLSNIPQKSFQLFSKLLRRVQNIRDVKFEKTVKDLSTLKDDFVKWAQSKGISTDKAMEMMLQIDDKGNWNGNFLNIYKKEFYTEKKNAIESNNAEWLLNNLVFDDILYKEEEKKQIEIFKSVLYSAEAEQNAETIEKKIQSWISNNRVVNPDGTINKKALFNENNRFLKADNKWHTTKWNELNKKENAPVKAVYDKFQSLIKESKEYGMLDKYSPHFIPSMYADKIDQLVFGDLKSLFSTKGFFERLEVDSGTKYTPEIDPTTGEVINRIPVYYTKDMGVEKEDGTIDYSKKSRDLFKIFGIWSAHMYNYEAMSSIENDALMLVETEKNKSKLLTDNYGNPILENGHSKAVNENDRNAKLLSDFVNYYIYDKVNGKFNDKKIKILGKEYSALKSANAAISFFSLKTLGLNVISGTANFVGGTGNALFQAQKGILFTKKSWAKGMYLATGDKKARAALTYFNILQEGNKYELINHLSLSSTNKIINKDNAYFIQRGSDKMVQYPVAVTMMLNHMVEDGKIVDIQKFVKDKYNYNTTFYNLSKSEQKALREKIDKEVEQLQNTRSLYEIGTLDKDGEFSIPGIEKESETFGQFRDKVKAVSKKILGNNSRDDINSIRTTMLGSALMQFRNWMPEMIEERFDGLRYDPELDTWTYGKLNQFFGEMFSTRFPRLLKSIMTGFGGDAIQMAKDTYERLKRNAYEKGEQFDITEGEFIDMYVGNLKSTVLELTTLLGFAALVLSVVNAAGDDDDKDAKGMKRYLARAIKKYRAEFAFYYDPRELTNLVKSPLPVVGLAEDMYRFVGSVSKEVAGQAIGNEDWTKKAKPMKYFFRMVPVAKEGMLVMAAFDNDFRKDWDIRLEPGF